MFNIFQRLVLTIPFYIRAEIAQWLHPDCRALSYTFIDYPYSPEELEALDLDEATLIIHNDIIHKFAEKER